VEAHQTIGHDMKSDGSPRRTGRPRSLEAEAAILHAALILLVQDGLEGMTIEGIAAQAGVGKTTIYRRWSTREEVVAAALRTLSAEIEIPDTGSTRDDLVAMMRELQRTMMNATVGAMIGRLAGITIKNPELKAIFWTNVLEPRRQALMHIVQRGRVRGELRDDLDVETALDMVVGTVLLKALSGNPDDVTDPDFPDRITDLFLTGASTLRDA
jgi:AcrR family transcriptional regulator